jgi:hypothetical protein
LRRIAQYNCDTPYGALIFRDLVLITIQQRFLVFVWQNP